MAIKYSIENNEKYLKVTANGVDDNLSQVMEYAQAVIAAAMEYQSSKILCDERNLKYNLAVMDTYQLAEFASQYAKYCAQIALVCNKQSMKDGEFYETVSSNRGLIVKVFSSFKEAEKWLE